MLLPPQAIRAYIRAVSTAAIITLALAACADSPRGSSPATSATNPCSTTKPAGEAHDLDVAACLTDASTTNSQVAREHPVELYLDKSASIQGFLDPDYPTHIPTDFRSVIDRLVVGVRPVKTYGYGENLTQVT